MTFNLTEKYCFLCFAFCLSRFSVCPVSCSFVDVLNRSVCVVFCKKNITKLFFAFRTVSVGS